MQKMQKMNEESIIRHSFLKL